MNRTGRIRLTAVSVLAVALVIFAAADTGFAQKCESKTDAEIVAEIYSDIDRDGDLSKQKSHINVVSVNQVVKLQGWTDNQNDYDDLVELVARVSCVRMINVNLLRETPPPPGDSFYSAGGCQKGTKPCGDVCIPEGDSCNITGGSDPTQRN